MAAFSGAVATCVPEDKLPGQVLGVGHSVHEQVSGYIESVRTVVEVTVTVMVGGMGDVGGGRERLWVKDEQEVEDNEVLVVEDKALAVEDKVLAVEDKALVVEVEQGVEDNEVPVVEVEQEVEDEVELEDEEVDEEMDEEVDEEVGQEVDEEVVDGGKVGQGGYNTMVVVAHPVRQAVSQAVVV